MEQPIIQARQFGDTWSVMARVWNPQKEFYEHSDLDEVLNNWVYIGS